jgi:hypothetical protein
MKIRRIVTVAMVAFGALVLPGVLLAQTTVPVRRGPEQSTSVELQYDSTRSQWTATVLLVAAERAPQPRPCPLTSSQGIRVFRSNREPTDSLNFGNQLPIILEVQSPATAAVSKNILVTCKDPQGDLTARIVATANPTQAPTAGRPVHSDSALSADLRSMRDEVASLSRLVIVATAVIVLGISWLTGLIALAFWPRLRRVLAQVGVRIGAASASDRKSLLHPPRSASAIAPETPDPAAFMNSGDGGSGAAKPLGRAEAGAPGALGESKEPLEKSAEETLESGDLAAASKEVAEGKDPAHPAAGDSTAAVDRGSPPQGQADVPVENTTEAEKEPPRHTDGAASQGAGGQSDVEAVSAAGGQAASDGEPNLHGDVAPSAPDATSTGRAAAGSGQSDLPLSPAALGSITKAVQRALGERLGPMERVLAALAAKVSILSKEGQPNRNSTPTPTAQAPLDAAPRSETVLTHATTLGIRPQPQPDESERKPAWHAEYERLPQQLNNPKLLAEVSEKVRRALVIYDALEAVGTQAEALSNQGKGKSDFLGQVSFDRGWLTWLKAALESGHWPMPFTLNPRVGDEKAFEVRIEEQLKFAAGVLNDPEQLVHEAERRLTDGRTVSWLKIVNRMRRKGDPDPPWLTLLRKIEPRLVEKHAPSGTVQWPQHQKLNEQAPGSIITDEIACGYDFRDRPLVPVLVSTENAPIQPPPHPAPPPQVGDESGT